MKTVVVEKYTDCLDQRRSRKSEINRMSLKQPFLKKQKQNKKAAPPHQSSHLARYVN